MRRRQWAIGVVAAVTAMAWLLGVCLAGTAPKAKTKAARTAPKAAASWKAARPSLPDWAPKDPSPEFLRAARLVKPLPEDFLKEESSPGPEGAARQKGLIGIYVASYELLGSLSDAQIDHFLVTREVVIPARGPDMPARRVKEKQVLVPVKQLTEKQRAALDRYFEAWRQAWKLGMWAGQASQRDLLILLYKMGARRDLSNVSVGADSHNSAGHVVSIVFHIAGQSGSTRMSFAQV